MKKNKLPKWNLDEIYVGHNDPKIDKNLKKLSKLTNQFIDKWKGKIKNLSGKEISNCLKGSGFILFSVKYIVRVYTRYI